MSLSMLFREPVNSITHLLGILFAIIGTILLILHSISPEKPIHIVTFAIFGSGLLLLYSASTLYHGLRVSEKWISRFNKIDHVMIFILIAATYTPICLVVLKGAWGWGIFGSVWGIAVIGSIKKLFWFSGKKWISTSIYLLMGWLIIIAIWPLIQILAIGGLIWLATGGILYSLGAVIYGFERPNPFPGNFGFHEIFHLFILGGSVSHYILMYLYVVSFE